MGCFYGKKVILLLDEYDTPMQEAYVNGYWQEFASFIRSLFNSTFKINISGKSGDDRNNESQQRIYILRSQ